MNTDIIYIGKNVWCTYRANTPILLKYVQKNQELKAGHEALLLRKEVTFFSRGEETATLINVLLIV